MRVEIEVAAKLTSKFSKRVDSDQKHNTRDDEIDNQRGWTTRVQGTTRTNEETCAN
jgi:hypothetical protein